MAKKFIDIHTHSATANDASHLNVRSILLKEPPPSIPADELFTLGLHPWDTGETSLDPKFFKEAVIRPNCLGIGECGLDRLRGASLGSQTRIFQQQAVIAEAVQKPVIIHCVRAWLEILNLKNELRPSVPWIIHGFRGKAATASKLIEAGFYLSFGESLLSMNPVLAGILRNTPSDRFFLETDGGKCTIEEVYRVASDFKNLPLEPLQEVLLKNFEQVFGKHEPS